MARRKNVPGFSMSEPEFLISCMDRHEDWSVVIRLIFGAGQESTPGKPDAGMGCGRESEVPELASLRFRQTWRE